MPLWSTTPSKGPSKFKGKAIDEGCLGHIHHGKTCQSGRRFDLLWVLEAVQSLAEKWCLKTKLLGNRSRYIQIQPTLKTWLFHKDSWIHLLNKSKSECWFKSRTCCASLSGAKMSHTKLDMTRGGTTREGQGSPFYCLAQQGYYPYQGPKISIAPGWTRDLGPRSVIGQAPDGRSLGAIFEGYDGKPFGFSKDRIKWLWSNQLIKHPFRESV